MIDRGPEYAPTWRGRPGSMLDQDFHTWQKFLDQRGRDFTAFYYNVRITLDDLRARFTDEASHTIAAALLPKRIDALGERAGELWIIEVAHTTGLRSLGQLLTYETLYRHEVPAERRTIV